MSRAFNWPRGSVRVTNALGRGRDWTTCRRSFYQKIVVAENDIVLLKKKGDDSATPILTKPLRMTGRVNTARGSIEQANLIGKGIRDVVFTNKKVAYRIYQPSLAEYVTLSPRLVTPVYPADANLIVSLLDLHPSRADQDGEPEQPIEIFEAGTGHGALTLHLARAIHGANSPVPPVTLHEPAVQLAPDTVDTEPTVTSFQDVNSDLELNAKTEEYLAWRSNRRAVVHTLDISEAHSKHAESVVRNFRHGLYYHDVEFHVGTIQEYLAPRFESIAGSFLDHAILDLPSCDDYLEVIGRALKPNGLLVVFCPSITQINKCVTRVKREKLPFLLENVLELGAGVGVGGKEWDVRAVKPRALLKAEAEARKLQEEGRADLDSQDGSDEAKEVAPEVAPEVTTGTTSPNSDLGWEMVCRPKVGGKISGGGFLGLFRRMEQF